MRYLPRTLESSLKASSFTFPVLLVSGPRQVGKTTLLKRLCEKDRAYVTLDSPLDLELARQDPELFFERYPPPLLIDEIQYAPDLLRTIKRMVDSSGKKGEFWLTGSQQFHLMKGVSETLAGRIGIVNLLGFSLPERLGRGAQTKPFLPVRPVRRTEQKTVLGLKQIYEIIWKGSFPALATDHKLNRDIFFQSYVQTYLQRDIHDLSRVGDEMAFLRFLKAAAARTAQLLNLSELARDADVSVNTAKAWLSILSASGMVLLLEPWHSNVSKRLVKAGKLHFLDTGLCAYLTGWSSPETLEKGAMAGPFFETWVVSEIVKSYWHSGLQAPLYHYRDRDNREIDLLIVRDGALYPVEIKKTGSPKSGDVRAFEFLKTGSMKIGHGCLICPVRESIPLSATADAVPISTLAN